MKRFFTRRRRLRAPQPEDKGIESFFTNTKHLIDSLQALAKAARSAKRIFIIHGVGAVGKTAVLLMARLFCKREGIAVAYAPGNEVITPVDILSRFVEELEESHVDFPRFDKTFKRYLAIQLKAEQEAKSLGEKTTGLVKEGLKVGGKVAAYALPYGKLGEDVGVPLASAVVDVLASKLSQPDYELYRESVERLTEVFLEDIVNIDPPRRLVLMLDTYEQLEALDNWVRDLARRLPDNVLLVIAGRVEVGREWDAVWPGWVAAAQIEPLGLMSDDHLRELVQRYSQAIAGSSPDAQLAGEIVRFARGLPMAVTIAVNLWAKYGSKDFPAIKPRVVEDLYDQLMRGTPAKLRATFEEAAALRWFNREALRFMANAKEDTGFEELRRFPFILISRDGFRLHDVVRTTVNDSLKFSDPERYVALHLRASEYYEQKLAKLSESGSGAAEERQKYLLELTYHRFQVSENEGLKYLAQVIESELFNRRQLAFCQALLHELNGYDLSRNIRRWLKYYEGMLSFYEGREPDRPRQILEELNNDPELDVQLKVNVLEELAGIHWFYSLRETDGTRKARELYNQCLELRSANPSDIAGLSRILTWLGILQQRAEGNGEEFFKRALNLIAQSGLKYDSITAGIERELSIALRMQGRFAESLRLITSSIEKFGRLDLQLHKTHSLVNYGMLLLFMGRLREAEVQLQQSIKLYEGSGHPQVYERAWPLVGLGNVALGRGETGEALATYEKALQVWKDDSFGLAVVQGGMAEVYLARGDWDEALDYAEKSLALKVELADKFGLAWTLNTKGQALMGKQQYPEALRAFLDGYQQMTDYGSEFGKSRLALSLCEVYLHLERINDFRQQAQEIETLGTLFDYFHDLAHLSFLKGLFELKQYAEKPEAAAPEALIRSVASDFQAALAYALQYNIYLLDSMLEKVRGALENSTAFQTPDGKMRPSAIYTAILNGWKNAKLGDEQLTRVEASKRKDEARDGKHQQTVAVYLQSLRAEKPLEK